ncbi:Cold shock protein [Perkinsela sp. CCAP 1560/4]|nr:Cold shock protein [Perkinsela sp. CCAP 1560/4]|eukprot:KNH03622.1 Cold shock protein [Perkinsela sp. CCAP 1560/4]
MLQRNVLFRHFARSAAGIGSSTSILLDRQTGIVKTWIDDKGFGFVTDASTNEDVFVHFRELTCEKPRKMLTIGEEVEMDVEDNNGRKRGVRVTGPGGVPLQGGDLDPGMMRGRGRGRGGGRGRPSSDDFE